MQDNPHSWSQTQVDAVLHALVWSAHDFRQRRPVSVAIDSFRAAQASAVYNMHYDL